MNSWGASWGERGTMKMSMDTHCHIEDFEASRVDKNDYLLEVKQETEADRANRGKGSGDGSKHIAVNRGVEAQCASNTATAAMRCHGGTWSAAERSRAERSAALVIP